MQIYVYRNIKRRKVIKDYKSIKINWDDYKDKFILTNNNKLTFLNITRIF